ncbi:MAG: hypothetical protein AUH79_05170 [Betaproteobacteria bacterium 13_1_40CM_4_64_4]|nr:MAG: hypothetical protein AUH79_05170 [Betaproteobacteria bacterium 13_1_40CM_4_64_4]
MSRALLGGLIARGQASDALAVVEIDAEARATVAARFGVATFAAIEPTAIGSADVIVIAVKPQNVRVVARELATLLKRQVVLTIAAGIRLSDLSRWLLGYRRLVRADSEGRSRAAAVLDAVGSTLWCEREDALDAVTAVSGSGPAYVFYFLEALEQAAHELGFTPAEARRLSVATFSGSIRLAEQSDSEPALLRAQVTSKGGTTERAIATLDQAAVKAAIVAAVKAAAERARELGRILGDET